jgi:fused signal recognition particle receptor
MAKNPLAGLFSARPRADAEPPAAGEPPVAPKPKGFFSRLAEGLTKSSTRIGEGVAAILAKKKLDRNTLGALEELLIAADLGAPAAARVVAALAEGRFDKEVDDLEVRVALADVVARALAPLEAPLIVDRAKKPFVILMTGVNGAGKTTTIGKLAARFRAEGMTPMLAAGDTFRAAAIDQLRVWGERVGAEVVARPPGADAAGLAFAALERARAAAADVLIIDTAGRLQNRRELMDELGKIVRVLKKLDAEAPHATLLTLDATVGQNAILQAEAFREIAGVNGLVMTKLDGTARGGILVALGEKFGLPIHFIGVGEGVDDLQPFRARDFSRALAGLARTESAA